MPVLDLFSRPVFKSAAIVRGISNPGQFPQGIRITLDSSNGNQMRSVSFPYQFLDHWPYFFRIDHRFHRFTQQMKHRDAIYPPWKTAFHEAKSTSFSLEKCSHAISASVSSAPICRRISFSFRPLSASIRSSGDSAAQKTAKGMMGCSK